MSARWGLPIPPQFPMPLGEAVTAGSFTASRALPLIMTHCP